MMRAKEAEFCSIIEKRARKALREALASMRLTKSTVFVCDSPLTHHLAKRIITMQNPIVPASGMPSSGVPASGSRTQRVIRLSSRTVDNEIESFLDDFFAQKKKKANRKAKNTAKKTILLFKHLSESELQEYAKIKRVQYKRKPVSDIRKLVDRLAEHYPETKASLIKSIRNMQKLS